MILAQIHYNLSHEQAKFPRILSQNGQNYLEGQDQWLPFAIPAKSIPGYIFGANLVIPAQTWDKLSHRQGQFPKILSQNCQNDLGRSTSMTPIFDLSWEYPMMHVWCKFGDFSSNLYSVPSYHHAEKLKFMDGQTDRRRQWKIPHWPWTFRPGVKWGQNPYLN